MPQIRPYESQVSSQSDLPGRSAGLQDFGGTGLANLGQGIQNLGVGAAHAERVLHEQKARQGVTDIATQMTDLRIRLTGQMDELAKNYVAIDPQTGKRNPMVSEQMQGLLKSHLDTMRGPQGEDDRFTTQEEVNAFTAHAAATVEHFTALGRQVDAKLAGEAAVTQYDAKLNSVGNFLQQHPDQLAHFRAMGEADIREPDGIYPVLGRTVQDKFVQQMNEHYAVSATEGLTRHNPTLALRLLRDPELRVNEQYGWMAQYIPHEQMAPLINQAETEVRAIGIEARQAAAELRLQQTELHHATDRTLMAKYALHEENPTNPQFPPLTATEVGHALQENRLDGEVGRAMLNMLEEYAKPGKVKTNQEAYWALFNRIHAPFGDPRRLTDLAPIYEAAGRRRQLSPPDMERLRKEFLDARTSDGQKLGTTKLEFLAGYKMSIDKSNPVMGKLDQEGGIKFSEFQYFVDQEVERYTKENKDPSVLFNPDPSNTEFLGRHVGRFQKPLMESIRDFSKNLNRAPSSVNPSGVIPVDKQRRSGETPQQYLDRMKK